MSGSARYRKPAGWSVFLSVRDLLALKPWPKDIVITEPW